MNLSTTADSNSGVATGVPHTMIPSSRTCHPAPRRAETKAAGTPFVNTWLLETFTCRPHFSKAIFASSEKASETRLGVPTRYTSSSIARTMTSADMDLMWMRQGWNIFYVNFFYGVVLKGDK